MKRILTITIEEDGSGTTVLSTDTDDKTTTYDVTVDEIEILSVFMASIAQRKALA